MRNIPLRALETEILGNGGLAIMTAHARLPGPDLATLASYYATTFGPAARRTWVTDSFHAQLPGGEDVRALRQAPSAPVRHQTAPRRPLERPG